MENNGDDSLCLHRLFERQAGRTPEAVALVDRQDSLTYEELNRRAERLASCLRGRGIGPEDLVGIYMERRAEYVIASLAALKAGAAFLTLELAYPPPLLAEVVADAEPRVVLTLERYADRLPEQQERVCLDGEWEGAAGGDCPLENGLEPHPEALAFVSYSSGTTGKPKGIANPHRAAIRCYSWRFGVSDCLPGNRVGCNVFFIWEMLRPLLRGATTYVIPDDVIYDPAALVGFLEENRITETVMTPSLLQTVLNAHAPDLPGRLANLKTLWLIGEVVTKNLARRAVDALPRTRVLNAYGISETHEVAAGDLRTLMDHASSTYCPVGRPMDPERTYLLDAAMRPVGGGEPGELYIGGGSLARGYLNRPELTAQRFLEDPFAGEQGARMYRTGDKARLLEDGSLEILGRIDFMVKIRGYSVELGAVEAAIEKHLAVRDCVVVAEGEEGQDKRLVAYLVPDPGGSPDGGDRRLRELRVDPGTGGSPEIRRRLQGELPHYAVPAVYVEVEALPIQSTTGKVDRRRLPVSPPRVSANRPAEYAPPAGASRQEREALLARIFEDVLLLERGDVRRDDAFFDVGGHSLAAAQLVSHVEDVFGMRYSVSAFLANPTVAGLCEAVEVWLDRGKDGRRQAATGGEEKDGLNLRAEAVLGPGITAEQAKGGEVLLRDAGSVFLTGATGFLGAFVLDDLLARTDAEVRCLVRPPARGASRAADPIGPIRANMELYGLWRPGLAHRITPVVGDLGNPMFGMAEDGFDELARAVDLIFHAGAMVNMIYPYSALRAANVGGTRTVLRLACRHKTKPVHYVSTSGIFPPGYGSCREDVDLDSLVDARKDGYGQSKWAAEKLVWQAAERGVPVRVYRPGNISGHSASGVSNPRDFLGALVIASLRLGRAPRIGGWRLEMTPVDTVSAAMLRLADAPFSVGQAFNLTDPDPVPAETFFGWLENAGYPLERLDYPDWLEALQGTPREGEADVAGSILHGASPDERAIWDGNIYEDTNTRRALGGTGTWRPQVDASLAGTYLRYFEGKGLVNPIAGSTRRDTRVGAEHG